jgi:hypothetical protein
MGLQDFSAVKIYIVVFWVITPCSLVGCKQNTSEECSASISKVEDGGCRNPENSYL